MRVTSIINMAKRNILVRFLSLLFKKLSNEQIKKLPFKKKYGNYPCFDRSYNIITVLKYDWHILLILDVNYEIRIYTLYSPVY
jgi:hypothetical protein